MDENSPYWQERANCSNQNKVVFFRQLSTLMGSGVPIIDALQVSMDYASDSTLALVSAHLQSRLDSGRTLSEGMAEFPRLFSPITVAFIRVGEENGSLVLQLGQVARWMERDQRLRRKVIAALVYPVCALALTAVLTLVMFITVIPGFVEMFQEMEVELPLPTKILAAVTAAVTEPLAWAGVVFLLTTGLLASRSFLESSRGRLILYRAMLRAPVVGPLLRYTSVARFAFALSAMLGSGCNLLLTLRLAVGVSGSPLLQHRMDEMLRVVREGGFLSEFMEHEPQIFPKVVAGLVGVGEHAARLPQIFAIVASHFEEMVEHQVQLVTTLLEPVLMSLVAAVVGFVVVSVFLPMYGFLDRI